jgi:phosphatidate cytidylyltransferase
MVRRLTLGPVLILLFLGLMWLDEALEAAALPGWLSFIALRDGKAPPGLVLMLAGCLVCGRAAVELARMYRATGVETARRVEIFAAVCGVLAGSLTIGSPARSAGGGVLRENGGAVLSTALLAVVVWALLVHVRHRTIKGACGAVGAALMAFVYSGVLLGFLMAIRTHFSAWVLVGVIMTAKSCDIGAYFTGVMVGRHKLIPWVSPGKTWEGLVGGMVISGFCGAGLIALAQRFGGGSGLEGLAASHGFVAGAVLGLFAQLGDLSASILKRDAGIKDSGRLLPGFGGIIDVIDSLILAGPVAYWSLMLLRWMQAGSSGTPAPVLGLTW